MFCTPAFDAHGTEKKEKKAFIDDVRLEVFFLSSRTSVSLPASPLKGLPQLVYNGCGTTLVIIPRRFIKRAFGYDSHHSGRPLGLAVLAVVPIELTRSLGNLA